MEQEVANMALQIAPALSPLDQTISAVVVDWAGQLPQIYSQIWMAVAAFITIAAAILGFGMWLVQNINQKAQDIIRADLNKIKDRLDEREIALKELKEQIGKREEAIDLLESRIRCEIEEAKEEVRSEWEKSREVMSETFDKTLEDAIESTNSRWVQKQEEMYMTFNEEIEKAICEVKVEWEKESKDMDLKLKGEIGEMRKQHDYLEAGVAEKNQEWAKAAYFFRSSLVEEIDNWEKFGRNEPTGVVALCGLDRVLCKISSDAYWYTRDDHNLLIKCLEKIKRDPVEGIKERVATASRKYVDTYHKENEKN